MRALIARTSSGSPLKAGKEIAFEPKTLTTDLNFQMSFRISSLCVFAGSCSLSILRAPSDAIRPKRGQQKFELGQATTALNHYRLRGDDDMAWHAICCSTINF